ncbi:MAG TPA: hypothetical protein VN843_34935, partial [Anaerolineales bacterium]|nr:hypothetical protein [Anaerolineales bacterium]
RGPRIEVRDKATGFPSSESPLSSLKDIQTRREVAKLTTAKHAATTDFPDLTIELTLDDNGQISGVGFVKLSDDSMAQSTFEHGAMFVEEYLEHHGIKGMKWGVTRAHIQASIERRQQKQDTVEAQRREARPAKDPVAKDSIGRSSNQHTTIKTKGGEDHPAHPEAIKIAELRQKLDKSGPAALSNKDLQEIQTRLNLERSVAQLESERKQGKSFVNKLLRQHGQQSFETLGREANKQASKEIGGQVGKAVGKNVVKGAAKQAGKLAYAL